MNTFASFSRSSDASGTIGVRTQRSNHSQVKFAGFWLRAFAGIYDSLIYGIVTLSAMVLIMYAGESLLSLTLSQLSIANPWAAAMAVMSIIKNPLTIVTVGTLMVTPFVVQILFYTAFESSYWCATPGKILLGLAVCDYEYSQLSMRQAFSRNFYKFLGGWISLGSFVFAMLGVLLLKSTLLSGILLLLGTSIGAIVTIVTPLMAAFTNEKQGLHDIAAGCYVVRLPQVSSLRRIVAIVAAVVLIAGVTYVQLRMHVERPAKRSPVWIHSVR